MSPRKTRRATKANNADDELLMETTLSTTTRQSETPNVTLRSKRATRQAKIKSDSDDDVVPKTPLLNSSKRSTRKTKKTPAAAVTDNDESLNVTAASAKKRSRKTKTQDSSEADGDKSSLKTKKSRELRGRKKIVENDEKLAEDNETIADAADDDDDDDVVTNEDKEVANVSEKILKIKDLSLPRFRELQKRNSSSFDTTPESSPITVDLTPHRSNKTPRKSPVNIGSPKTHSVSPKKKSKTPRKLPVSSLPEPQASTLDTSIDDLSLKTNKTKRKSASVDELNTSKTKAVVVKSKTPKIVFRKSKSKSPKPRSAKKSNKTISPQQEKLTSNQDRMIKELENGRSPQIILKRISSSLISSGVPKPIASQMDSPSLKLNPEPASEEIKTPLKTIITTRFHKMSKSSTPIQTKNDDDKLSSSTPRGFKGQNLTSCSILSVDTFYGSSPKTSSTRINEGIDIADESSPLISEDDDSFEISGITAANNTTINKDDNKNDTYELPEPKTPNLKKKKNATYELDEPVTPGLKKSAKKRSLIIEKKNDEDEIVKKDDDVEVVEKDDDIIKKRVCKVRFASPSVGEKLNKSTIVGKPLTSRSATPGTKNVNKKINESIGNDSQTATATRRRRRSNSLSTLNNKTPTSIVKRRSNSNVDENRGKSSAVKAQNESVNRLSRPRQSLASEKKSNNEQKQTTSARKIPNFSQIHQKKFSAMESLVDVKKRIELRHKELTNNLSALSGGGGGAKTADKTGPTVGIVKPVKSSVVKPINPPVPPPNGAYNRFGFKTRKQEAIQNVSKEAAPAKIEAKKEKKRQILKGVRQNRRFELMMKSRNVN